MKPLQFVKGRSGGCKAPPPVSVYVGIGVISRTVAVGKEHLLVAPARLLQKKQVTPVKQHHV